MNEEHALLQRRASLFSINNFVNDSDPLLVEDMTAFESRIMIDFDVIEYTVVCYTLSFASILHRS